jgi:Na+-transporting methylmalonyl-CoA/oxaloacetate decarboxylase gamma subunit
MEPFRPNRPVRDLAFFLNFRWEILAIICLFLGESIITTCLAIVGITGTFLHLLLFLVQTFVQIGAVMRGEAPVLVETIEETRQVPQKKEVAKEEKESTKAVATTNEA